MNELEIMDYDVTFGARKNVKKYGKRGRRYQRRQQQQYQQQQQQGSDQDTVSSVLVETDLRSSVSGKVSVLSLSVILRTHSLTKREVLLIHKME